MTTTAAPSLSAALVGRWGILSAELIADTRSSLVYRVERHGGTSAIAKLLKPQGLHELPGMDFLAFRQGSGSVCLFDRVDDACLIEDAGRLTLRQYRLSAGEDASNAVIAGVLRQLHSPSPAPVSDRPAPLRRHFGPLLDRAAWPAGPALGDALARCASIAEALLDRQTQVLPLHGDLHHDNLLSGSSGWLAIDPQGLIGDAAYDVANIFGNPEGALSDILKQQRILTLCRLFSGILNCSEKKILAYAIAHAGLSICWSLSGGRQIDEDENARERRAFLEVALPLLDNDAVSG